jgi:hypothetical protein
MENLSHMGDGWFYLSDKERQMPWNNEFVAIPADEVESGKLMVATCARARCVPFPMYLAEVCVELMSQANVPDDITDIARQLIAEMKSTIVASAQAEKFRNN